MYFVFDRLEVYQCHNILICLYTPIEMIFYKFEGLKMKLSMPILQFPFDFSSERFYVSHNWSSPLSIEVETIWFCFGFQLMNSGENFPFFRYTRMTMQLFGKYQD